MSIEQFLERAYLQLPDTNRAERRRMRSNKTQFELALKRKGLGISRPALNQYLDYGEVPWPLPPEEDLIYVVDGETHHLRWVSPSLADLLGWARDQMVGKPMLEVLHPGENILSTQPQYLTQWILVQHRAIDRAEHPERADLQLKPEEIDQVVIETHFTTTTTIYEVILRVSYGYVYRTWFVHGQVLRTYPRPPAEAPQQDIFNVDPTIKYVVKRPDDNDLLVVEDFKDLLELPRARRLLEYYVNHMPRYRFPSTTGDEGN